MVCKIFFAPNSLIFPKSCGEETEDGENRQMHSLFAFQANAKKKMTKKKEHTGKLFRAKT